MAFQGDLGNISLASVFQNLHHNEQTGTLHIREGEREGYIYFEAGRVTMHSSGRDSRPPIGEVLVRRKAMTDEQLASAEKRRRGKREITAVLTRMGIAEEKIRDAVSSYVLEELCDLFTWGGGHFEFTEGEPLRDIFDPDVASAGLRIEVDAVLLEAARRADEWDRTSRQIRSQSEIFVPRKERAADMESALDEDSQEVVSLLDGKRDVATLVVDSGLGRFRVWRALANLLEQDFVRPLALTDVMRQAEFALKNREWETATRCFRRALEMERGNILCHRGLAEALEGSGEKADAMGERKVIANTLADLGRKAEAAEELRKAIEDVPTDLTAQERYIALLRDCGEARTAETATTQLGRTYLQLGLADKAKELLLPLLDSKPRDFAAVAALSAEACLKTGDIPAAVGAYMRAGEHHLAAEETEKARDAFEEILKIQPGHPEAKRRLDEITSGSLVRRRRRWKVVKWCALAVLVLAGAVAWLVYDALGRFALAERNTEALSLVWDDKLEKAMACYQEVVESYPFTYASVEAHRAHDYLSDALAMSLIEEGAKLERAGDRKLAVEKYTRAAALVAGPATRERASKALERLRAEPPGAPPAGGN